jgi:hypothetical protein
MDTPETRRRMTDTSTAEARRVLAGALAQFGDWRSDLANFSARAGRGLTAADRAAMLKRCDAIAAELLDVRTALILDLADAPPKVAGHSRVVDVEKALDGVEAQAAELRRRLLS